MELHFWRHYGYETSAVAARIDPATRQTHKGIGLKSTKQRAGTQKSQQSPAKYMFFEILLKRPATLEAPPDGCAANFGTAFLRRKPGFWCS
jgi:hypothetical protein